MTSAPSPATLPDWGGLLDDRFSETPVLTPPDRASVVAAGDRLREVIPADAYDNHAEAFRIAHDWREAHLVPMHRMLVGLSARARSVAPDAIVAGRIKRLSSVRKKLRRSRINLWDIQDIAGVRAIVPDMDAVQEIVRRYESGQSRHRWAKSDNHIAEPKASGYRSHHLMMRFVGDGELAALNRRSVEIQVRTRLQHSWATALEAVGLMRGEDLKAGEGNADWLRFFALISGQFAEEERQPMVPGLPEERAHRLEEIRHIEDQLGAIATLESYNAAIRRIGTVHGARGGRFTIRFDRHAQSVTVTPFYAGRMGDGAEAEGQDVVVVEVDRIDALAEAYPNYFADVTALSAHLRKMIQPEEAAQEGIRAPGNHKLSWLHDYLNRLRK
ncbi:RelA/SpoT domain-containing protein [Brevundimonas sp. FT23028]|uniref:RelA/SpoT domain-containing protein n=1 Tax=Brevundimonas sp. FT23028 TaxID=3393748 RepID=UPI003B588981